ncbi:MAG: efflux RND transporter periplasmic adaptor subunit, partial [Planctomycetota bacterium]
ILSLIPEGVHVKPGDLLVELDSSRLEEQLAGQQIKVINAEAAFVRARENHAVVKSQAESNIAQADLDLRFARLDLEKYVEGEYPQQLQQAEGDITIATEEVQRAIEKLEWSKRLHEKRYLSRVELQADEMALKKARLDLELAQGKKAVLERYSHKRDFESLKSDIDQAEKALERTTRKASADMVQADAELRAKEQEFKRQKTQLEKIEDQIKKCRIFAPVAGMVVYSTTSRGGWRGREEPLEEGSEVRERQDLISLPTASSMMAEVNVHESNLKKVRVGLPVHLSVDAAPGKVFRGKVARIAVLPDSQSAWLNPDLKLYDTDVHIEGDGSDLRPGMSCRAEIFVARHESTLHVPVQCVVRVAGRPTVYVKSAEGLEARPIKIGLDNNRMLHVLEGLEEGEAVLLKPPLGSGGPAAEPELPDVQIPDAPQPGRGAQASPGTTQRGSRGAGQTGGSERGGRPQMSAEMRKRIEQMTPEQRQKFFEEMRKNRGGGGG